MLENYVKFLRGTPDAYEKLANKNADTLYFISELNAETGKLYLGTKLIAGGISGDLTLSNLKDFNLSEDIANGDILVYTENGWTNANLEETIGVFSGAGKDPDYPGLPGLVPAPAAGQVDAFLKSDGTWATIAPSQNIIIKINENNDTHADLLAEEVNSAKDDIIIIKDIIIAATEETPAEYIHSAYVYDGNAWEAMRYDADNVYFKNDFIFTESVGTVAVPKDVGNKTVEAAGLSVKQFLAKIFAEEKDPTYTAPSVTLTMNPAVYLYEAGSEVTQGYSVSFSSGAYQYGPNPTGVSRTEVNVKDSNGNILQTMEDTFPTVTATDDFNYTVECSAKYSDGFIPKTNLGNSCATKQIKAGTTSKKTSSAIKSYRKTFWGCVTTKKDAYTSDDIRALNSSTSAKTTGSQFDVPVEQGCVRVIIAYPASLGNLHQVLDFNDSSANITEAFNKEPIVIQVEGANNYNAIDYNVYMIDFAEPYSSPNIFKVTI